MNIFKKLFRSRKNLDVNRLFDNSQTASKIISHKNFASLSSDERLGVIMSFGDTGEHNYFDLLKYAIQSDPDIDVKFAALKRIHLFKEHTDLIPFLNSLNDDKKKINLEPYLSVALSRVGIISKQQFEQRINTFETQTEVASTERWTKFDNGFLINTKGSEGGHYCVQQGLKLGLILLPTAHKQLISTTTYKMPQTPFAMLFHYAQLEGQWKWLLGSSHFFE